jgi:hypothetical protein
MPPCVKAVTRLLDASATANPGLLASKICAAERRLMGEDDATDSSSLPDQLVAIM